MFANRFTVLADACVLAPVLKRNLLLSLAEADFFRIRWSAEILNETEAAIVKILAKKQAEDPAAIAARQRQRMQEAFAEASVNLIDTSDARLRSLPDAKDAHVVAAAVTAQASVIVTDNLKDFPSQVLFGLNMEAKTADAFIADTIDLDQGRAVPVVRGMRARFKRPERTAEDLMLDLEACGLLETADVLRNHIQSL